mmetsp:Transcript_80369/g.167399  ORF Transcript_80369/g.167399 Transcript_80369/m.167399 type:complete len:87 (-) Transcript_80369:5-265(-)
MCAASSAVSDAAAAAAPGSVVLTSRGEAISRLGGVFGHREEVDGADADKDETEDIELGLLSGRQLALLLLHQGPTRDMTTRLPDEE